MPHFDFRKALASSVDPVIPFAHPTGSDPVSSIRDSRQSQERLLAHSDWTSLLFALLVFSGGLFCAFYFFNGTELLRTVKALPHELLYPRPSTEMQGSQSTQTVKIDVSHRGSEQGSRLARNEVASSDDGTRPIAPNLGSPQLNPSSSQASRGASNGPTSTSPSNPSSAGNVLRSGADALSRTSAQAVTNVAQAKVSDVKRTAMRLPKRVSAAGKTAKQKLAKTKTNAAQLPQNVQRTSRPTGLAQNDATHSRPTNSGVGSLGRQGLGGFGHGGGAGGLGGRLPGGASMGLSGGHH